MELQTNILAAVGRKAIIFWAGVKNFSEFTASIVRSFQSLKYLRFRAIYTIAVNQTKFTGFDTMPIVILLALIIGAVVIIQAMTSLPKFGIEGFIGNLMVIIVARELGPMITALIVISRSGSAIAAEIATQHWSKEILSLEIMGIDTKLYIVFPRIIASIVSIFSLIIIFDMVAFFGGYVISQTTVYIPADVFVQNLVDSFKFADLISAVTKSVITGILIPLIACYYGFMPVSKFEIPIYVSRAVIRTLSITIVINSIVSALFYFF